MLVTGKTSITNGGLGGTPSDTETWRRVYVVPRGAAAGWSPTLRNFEDTTVLCGDYYNASQEEAVNSLPSPAQEGFPQEDPLSPRENNPLPPIAGLQPLRSGIVQVK